LHQLHWICCAVSMIVVMLSEADLEGSEKKEKRKTDTSHTFTPKFNFDVKILQEKPGVEFLNFVVQILVQPRRKILI